MPKLMVKYLPVLLFGWMTIPLHGQSLPGPATVAGYSPAEKQLLVRTTAQFLQLLNQGSLDRDTAMRIACKTTGIPFLLAWSDDPDSLHPSPGASWIDSALWYLHQPGTRKTFLDSANYFIRQAQASDSDHFACLDLLAEYYRKSGNIPQSIKTYRQIIASAHEQGKPKLVANAWLQLGKMHQRVDSADLFCLRQALELYRQTGQKEKEIEVLFEIAGYDLHADLESFKKEMENVLDLQRSLGYKHSLFAQNLLAFARLHQSKLVDAMALADSAFENMKWSAMPDLAGPFYTRVGGVYETLGKNQEALAWFKKGFEHPTKGSELFWFKSLLYAVDLLIDRGQFQETLDLVNKMANDFPPVTPWQKAQIISCKADCYRHLHDYRSADKYQRALLRLYADNPGLDPYGELDYGLGLIADDYVARSDLKMALLFLQKMTVMPRDRIRHWVYFEHLYFKIDSSEGKYKSALEHYMRYKAYDDSITNINQRTKFEELQVKANTAKKDDEIRLLQAEKKFQDARLQQEKYTRNSILAVVALLLIIVGLLIVYSRLKQRTNNTLKHLLDEKSWLVKEIHHRIKNNLQLVMSLLNAQAAYIDNEPALDAIHNSQHRVHAMSLIHQKLYNSDNLTSVDASVYVRELIAYLRDSFSGTQRIRFHLEIEPVSLHVSQAVPLGLILNEAITNSIKYAFPGDRDGVISVSLAKTGHDRYLLVIADDGVGMPHQVQHSVHGSLGMRLMMGLTSDLDGKMIIENTKGTSIKITFHSNNQILESE